MGFRFRKSKKIMPGVRLNFSKKGMGVSFGGKHARYSISPTGRRTTSFKVAPGLTYTTSSGGRKRRNKRRSTAQTDYTYSSPRKQIKPSNAVAVIFSFLSFFLIWIIGIELGWNATLLKVISILIITLFIAFMLVNNIPPLKALFLGRFRKDKKTDVESYENQTENNRTNILDSPEKMEQYSAANSLRICRESIKIIYETTNPDTFFSRYEIILRKTANIEAHSDKFNFGDLSPQTMRQEVVNGKQKYVRNMIDRYWNETVKGAESLKTDNGKKNRYQKFYDTLEQYKNEISEENIRYYTDKYHSAVSCLK